MNMKVNVKILRHDSWLPAYATSGAAGIDFEANLEGNSSLVIMPGETKLVKTGLAMEIPEGYELQIRSRSGMTLKHGIVVLNAPGTIDSDYRGEIGIILHNVGGEPYTIENGSRIAQGVFAKYEKVTFDIVQELSDTNRADGGFGSTGK